MAGLIKAALAVYHGEIPPSLHYTAPNPQIDFAASPFYVNTALSPWPAADGPRRAGVSSFGIGGTNAHVVLEEAPALPPSPPGAPWQLLVLSAKSGPALEAATASLARHLEAHPELPLADVAHTLHVGRALFDHRRTVVAADSADAIEALASLDQERVGTRVHTAGRRAVTFLFPGQGAQYPGMGAGLYTDLPVYRREIDRGLALLDGTVATELRELLAPAAEKGADADRRLARTEIAQPALFLVEHALARQWMDWGVQPQSFLGHSLGEYTAACLAGVMSFSDALTLVAERGRLIGALPGGAMLSILASERELLPYLAEGGPGLALAAVNAPSSVVAAGPAEAIDGLERRLAARGVVCRRLATSHAFHSAMMEGAMAPFAAAVARIRLRPPEIPFLSNLTGTWVTAAQATDPAYWTEHLRRTVRFGDGLRELLADPEAVLLEVGPGRMLKTAARWYPDKGTRQVVETSLPHPRERRPDLAFLLGAVGRLWLAGVEPDWTTLDGPGRRRVPLPTYPFERRRFWIAPPSGGALHRSGTGSLERKEDLADWFYQPAWRETPAPLGTDSAAGRRAGSWAVLAHPGGLAERLAARLEAQGRAVVRIPPGSAPADPETHVAWLADLGQKGVELAGIVHAWSAEEPATGEAGDGAELELGFHALLALARALGGRGAGPDRGAEKALPVVVLSRGAQAVTGGEELAPIRATLLGPIKVIPREDPRLACRSIDLADLPLAGSAREERLLDHLIAELEGPAADTVVAWRHGRRWVQEYAPLHLPVPEARPLPLPDPGVWWITGGLGGVGLEIAGWLAARGPVRLVLSGRSSFPERESWDGWLAGHPAGDGVSARIRRLLALERAGAEVMIGQADVTDRAAMAALAGAVRRRFGLLQGVIHAAGVPDGGFIQLRSRAASEAVLAAKVEGARILVETVFGPPGDGAAKPDVLVFCSSLSGLVGRLGQVAYGAANAFLDAYARQLAATTGATVLSIDWGEWHEVGMAASEPAVKEALPEEPAAAAPAHPFLEAHRIEPSGEEVYSTRFSVGRHWVADEHRLVGHAVLPGVAYFEMVRAALATGMEARALRFQDVTFVAPVHVRDDASREVRLHLTPAGGEFRFAVRSPAEAGEGTLGEVRDYVVGRVGFVPAPAVRRYDLAALQERCNVRRAVFGEEDREDDLGPRWQNVRVAWVGEREVLTRLELAEELWGDLAVFKLHPALLDRAAGVAKEYLVDATYLPLTYGSLTVLRDLPPRIYTYARLRPEEDASGETLTFDISVLDDDGTVVVEIERFSQKLVHDATGKLRSASGAPRQPSPAAAPPAPVRREMTAAEGVEAFGRLLAWRPGPQIAVSVRDLAAVIAQADAAAHERVREETARRLPERPSHPRPALATPFRPPSTDAERAMAEAWQLALGIEAVGVDDNFFELGGDSVQAIQILSALNGQGIELTPQQFFERQTIARLAGPGAPAEPARNPQEVALPTPAPEELARLGLAASEIEDAYPLSSMQQGMLFHSLFAPGAGDYIEQVTFLLAGELDRAAFAAAWQGQIDRHPVLRTTFVWEGLAQPFQIVHRRAELPSEHLDWREVPAENRGARLSAFLEEDRRRGFDPAVAPLARLTEIAWGREERRFVWTYHHLLLDGWSAPLVLAGVAAAYEAAVAGRSPAASPGRPYRDFIAWLAGQDRAAARAFWQGELAGLEPPPPLALGERPAAAVTAGGEAAPAYHTARLALAAETTDRLREAGRRHHLTPNTLVQGAWALLLSRHGAASPAGDVLFGGVVSGRPPELAGAQEMVGLFINTLPIRVRVGEGPGIAGWLDDLQRRGQEAQRFSGSALAEIREWAGLPADRAPFDSILVFENLPEGGAAGEGGGRLALREVARAPGRTAVPLTVEAFPGDRLTLDLTGDGRFEPATVEWLLGHLATLLTALPEALDGGWPLAALSPLTTAEQGQLAGAGRARASATWQGPIHCRFEAAAGAHPQSPAVTADGEEISYGELDRRSSALAAALRVRGVGAEERVALLLPPSIDLIVAILAVGKAGGAYQPLDPEAPAERLASLLADGGARFLLAHGRLAAGLPASTGLEVLLLDGAEAVAGSATEAAQGGPPDPWLGSESLAYLLYTSGSTGQPKGVAVTHGNVARLFDAVRAELPFGPGDVWTLFHSAAFDFSVWEIWGALAFGGRLVIVPAAARRDPAAFLALLEDQGVTVLSQTPQAFEALMTAEAERAELIEGRPLRALRAVVFGGEALDPGRLAGFRARYGAVLANLYGITETTVHVTFQAIGEAEVARTGASPIGRPLADLSLQLIDAGGRLVPAGVAGEIAVGGAGLARGYHGRPDLTAPRFVPDPWGGMPGGRLYRSGDLARRRPDGTLDYLGRADRQIKIRGYRIEPAEVAAVLAAHPGLAAVAVEAPLDALGGRRLVAFVVPRGEEAPAAAELSRFAARSLPPYMVPSLFLPLAQLPRTANGKLDRRALADLAGASGRPETAPFVPPATPTEEAVAVVWREVLGVERIGAGDSFFELGGHSLLVARAVGRLRAIFHLDLPVRLLFERPVLAEVASAIDDLQLAAAKQEDLLALLAEIEGLPEDELPAPSEGAAGGG